MAEFGNFLLSTAANVALAYAGRPTLVKAPSYNGLQGVTPGQSFSMSGNGGIIEGAGMVYDCASGPPPPECGGSAVYKKVCGEYRWVYPRRRRRKQLVTKGDIKGLAALKGVLGNGKAMESWIATHG